MTSPSSGGNRVGDEIGRFIIDTVNFARVMERISNSATIFSMAARSLEGIAEVDPALKPEMLAALGHLEEINGVMVRAGKFMEARYEASKTRFEVFAAEEEGRHE